MNTAANSSEKRADADTRHPIPSSHSATQRPIPSSDSEITAEWFQDVTGIDLPKASTFQILPNSNAEVGNLSKMVRVGFVDEEARCRSYMVKLLPAASAGAELLDIVTSENMNGREVFFYATLRAHLERLVPELGQYFVQCLTSVKDDCSGSLLILQDLSPAGFVMPAFSDGLSPSHFRQSLNFIAKFHAAGELLQREHGKGAPLPQVYPDLNSWHVPRVSTSLFRQFKSLTWFPEGLQFVANHVLGNSPVMAQGLLSLIPQAENIIRFLVAEGSKVPTVIHDDLWPHNFLCHPTTDELKVIDYQLIGFSDPCYDLVPFLLSCLPIGDISWINLTTALRTYHDSKAAFYNSHNLDMARGWTDTESFFNSRGLGYGLVWFAMSADSIYANEEYRPKLARIFELLWEAAIPQFLLENAS